MKRGDYNWVVASSCILKSHYSHLGCHPIWSGSNEKQPLGHEIWDELQIMSARDRLHEFVPGQNKVREHEQYCSKGKQAASLNHCTDKHWAYEYGVNTNPCFHYSRWNFRDDLGEYHCKENDCTECYHCKISFGFSCKFTVFLHFLEISSDEIYDEPSVFAVPCDIPFVVAPDKAKEFNELKAKGKKPADHIVRKRVSQPAYI